MLNEAQFKQLSKGMKPLPTMAIATIKYDEQNRPKRVKYWLVVLGNHDPHQWSKEATAAPVMSQLELRILTSLAVFDHQVLKNCDIKQAFVQSSLPTNEKYFLQPPVGYPRSPPGTYWCLIRPLYGLCQAPRLWFEKLRSHLQSMGLKNSTTSPCLFVGHLIEGAPPIYVGIYVDDIIYFSSCNDVERKFEGLLSTIGDIDFRKAFDTVNPILLLRKLHNYGVDKCALALLENYFTDRNQIVKIDHRLSDSCPISLGVPQGSVLGPLFFSIFINDLSYALNLVSKLFADDTTLYKTFELKTKSLNDVILEFKQDIALFTNWCQWNRLDINWLKTFLMAISPKKNFTYHYPLI